MKKNWQAPRIRVQEFEANEYVATCYQLYCAISGDGKGGVEHESIRFDQGKSWNGGKWYVNPDHKDHGQPCANGSSYNDVTKQFYENSKPSSFVTNLDLGDSVGDGRRYAMWTSTDVSGNTGEYTHYGYAIATDNRPNHS